MSYKRLLSHLTISHLPGLGDALAKKFNHLGIYTIRDLLLHLPMRYEDRSTSKQIAQLSIGEHTTIEGQIIKTELIQAKRRMLICTVKDETGIIQLRFMNFYPTMKQSMAMGKWIKAYGEVKASKTYYEMIHPQIQIREAAQSFDDSQSERYTPIYATTFGLTQTMLRKFIHLALALLNRNPSAELIPAAFIKALPSVEESLTIVHQPPLDVDITQLELAEHPAKKRLIFEELLAYHLSMQITKSHNQSQQATPCVVTNDYIKPFLQALPFSPTNAQQRVVQEIWQDMAKHIPMMRLVQGDVGSGKTLVAALAALGALENQKQVVLMAPTEILAEQHAINFSHWFEPLGLSVNLLSGKLTAKKKRECYEAVAAGQTDILIGTHAVFVEQVKFAHLGLVIIDEQHRFGVDQRLTLWEKGIKDNIHPHQLIMTATPIPRTLAMTVYADLDVSTIDELPPGRTPITTVVLPNTRRYEVIERIEQACLSGKQVYWVCTLVEESDILAAQAAEVAYEELQALLPTVHVGLIHGKMKPSQKQAVMQNFKQGLIQLLVATTVIEVGVDVPNASLMVIENAERLGLSQLHQLRGRVGRGSEASHCVLMYQTPLSKVTKARLNVMRDSNDGFVIAQKDLEIRGGGEILGTRQVGIADFKVVDLMRDQHLIRLIQSVSIDMLANHPASVISLVNSWLPAKTKYINA
ncbi:ATP-dependent DNA helicase RecG [Orbus hercynius]|uniref:ATP-dependent DNA helicase RecG n=1 Tax=Orbus hercynius TaxID=593135 RepID=A0A495RD85_9GAMM|nr:ATP-dependent DNA helicase RecG [Orbus hercynius]RKS85226.1 ATP-dependent DNA helicase RecG [Orbus hercynius]